MRSKTKVTNSEASSLEDSEGWKGKVVWGQSCNNAQGLGRCEYKAVLWRKGWSWRATCEPRPSLSTSHVHLADNPVRWVELSFYR